MASGKARFLGNSAGRVVHWRFSETIRKKIKKLYPGEPTEPDERREAIIREEIAREVWGQEIGKMSMHQDDFFVDAIEHEARWAKLQLTRSKKDVCKRDILAELTSLLNRSQLLKDDFRMLSPSVKRLFPVAIEPLEYADYLEKICSDIQSVLDELKAMPRKESSQVTHHKIAVELAIRALRAAQKYGMNISATAHPKDYWISNAVQLMSYIGEGIDLDFKNTTWRDVIISAQNIDPNLKPKNNTRQ